MFENQQLKPEYAAEVHDRLRLFYMCEPTPEMTEVAMRVAFGVLFNIATREGYYANLPKPGIHLTDPDDENEWTICWIFPDEQPSNT